MVKQDLDPKPVRFMTPIIKQVALLQAQRQTSPQLQQIVLSYNSTTITTRTTQVISTTVMVTITTRQQRSPTLHSQVMWPLSRPQQHMVTV